MNTQMAYLIGMILGNGEVQRDNQNTTVTIDIPHKNLKDDEGLEVSVYIKSSLADIRDVLEPLIGNAIRYSQNKNNTRISFTKTNGDYVTTEILRFIGNGAHHSNMVMNKELFDISKHEKYELLKGIADVTGYIRNSNRAFGVEGNHRVYIEIPGNWELVIDICNLLKSVDIPVQTIDFGHPNFRDSNLKKYNEGKHYYWKKEHQIKIWANEFLPVGFNIEIKQRALKKYANEALKVLDPEKTHKFYWEKPFRNKKKPKHPMVNDENLPYTIRGKHYQSWTQLAKELGYSE